MGRGRFGTILSYTDFIDWKNFIYQKLAEDLGLRYAAVRRGDLNHVITSHAAVPSIFYSPYNGYGATDDFLMAEQVDFYGTSLYPKHNHPARHWEIWKFMVAVDFSRSANQPNGGFYVGELQAGHGTIGLNVGDPITPADHRIWMWSAIAKGARAINIYAYYPMSSGYESGGYGLINLDGSPTERAIAAGKTAQLITANQDLLLNAEPLPAQIALVYNPLAQMVGGEQRHAAGDMHQLSLFGYYRAFAESNIPVDFIHRRELEAGEINQYRLIILPYPLMLTQTAADTLKKFVARGGTLLAEARPAWNDERGFAEETIPGMGLAELFGVRETSVRMLEKVRLKPVSTEHCLFKELGSDSVLTGAYFAESFELLSGSQANIIATHADGTAGMTCHKYGEGQALLIGTFLGMANHQHPTVSNNRFLLCLLPYAGIEVPIRSKLSDFETTPVELRLQQDPGGYILFIINHGENDTELEIDLQLNSDREFQGRELLTDTKATLSHQVNYQRLVTAIRARDVQVWRIE
jgi:beta-galactosidase